MKKDNKIGMSIIMKKPPPKKVKGAQAKRLNSPSSIAPSKLSQQTGTTKTNKPLIQQKTRQLGMRNLRVLKDFWWVAYHDLLFVGRGTLWTVVKHHDALIQIVLLLIVLFLESQVHIGVLLHH